MLKQASLKEISDQKITKKDGYLVLTARYYPRFLHRDLIDEYVSELSPSRALLKEFKNLSKKIGHDEAFAKVHYEQKFKITKKGYSELERLAELSKKKPVYIICYCDKELCCHRELLMLAAKSFFKARTAKVHHPYRIFRARLKELEE